MNTPRRLILAVTLFLTLTGLTRGAPPAARVEFNRDIRPLLSDRCFACHGPDASHRKADLRLDTSEGARADLGGTRAIVPGKPEASELLQRISHSSEAERMPPASSGKTLSATEIDLIRRWIEQGAEYQPHWSFLPPRRPALPRVKKASWPRNDIDRFILAGIEQARLEPSPEADRITLIRRLSFDLRGLPPTRAEVDAFLQDQRPDAYERLVDQLLASPHYGERMAMYWLDLVRYASTVGYHGDQEHAISPYRDWVIKAFKDNMPFDRFTIEQLAGDLLPDAGVDQKIASGYLRVLQTSHEGGVQVKEYLSKYDADRVRSLSSVWMGATLGCAQCHDHKFDPYTMRDFYSMVAFFADVDDKRTFKGGDTTPTRREPELVVLSPLLRERIASLEAEADRIEARLPRQGPRTGELASLAAQAEALRQEAAELGKKTERTMITVAVEPRTIRILNRGDWLDDSGPVVQPAVPHFLPPLETGGRRATRLDLARWLTRPDHPQTSRVLVNRLWYLFLGEGLARTLDDLGAQGSWPDHPQLLDWLATELVRSGWDVKHMVRAIVTSSTYRQSSLVQPRHRQQDPENHLFARQNSFRLPAEMIRDNALALSGLLVDELGAGTSRPYQPEGYYAHLNFPKRTYKADSDARQYLRGVYMHWQRQFLHPMLRAFDAPSREECTARRPISNTPLAALTLLNDPTFVEAARVLAAQLLQEAAGASPRERIERVWRMVLSRRPQPREAEAVLRLYQQSLGEYQASPKAAQALLAVGLAPRPRDIPLAEHAAWTAVARVLLNLNETITRN